MTESYRLATSFEEAVAAGERPKMAAARLGRSPAWASRTQRALRGASPSLRAAWESGAVTTEIVYRLADRAWFQQEALLAELHALPNQTGRGVKRKHVGLVTSRGEAPLTDSVRRGLERVVRIVAVDSDLKAALRWVRHRLERP